MTTQTLDRPVSQSLLGDAAKMMANHMETGFEPLSTIEAQAFAVWLHGAYLSIFLHVDDEGCGETLLSKRIYRMINEGASVLMSSKLSSVAEIATRTLGDFQYRVPKLDSRDLFSLAARLPLGPRTKQLVAWVDLAYGDAPRPYEGLVYFAVRADGALYQNNMPSVSVLPAFLTPAWRRLPPFWRVIYLISQDALPYRGSADYILGSVISVSALPLSPQSRRALLFTNYIALLHDMDLLFGSDVRCERNATLIYRLLQPWDGLPVKGSRFAEDWLAWMTQSTLEQCALSDTSPYRIAMRRLVQNRLNPTVLTSLEAIDPSAQPEDDVDEPNVDGGDEGDAADVTAPDPDATDDSGETPPDEIPDGTDPDPSNPQTDQNNNSIGDITLTQDGDPGSAYLYRRAVLSLDDILARDPNIDVSQDVRQALHLWCRDWLWLASVTQTHKLIKDLGLQKALGPVAKEGLS